MAVGKWTARLSRKQRSGTSRSVMKHSRGSKNRLRLERSGEPVEQFGKAVVIAGGAIDVPIRAYHRERTRMRGEPVGVSSVDILERAGRVRPGNGCGPSSKGLP